MQAEKNRNLAPPPSLPGDCTTGELMHRSIEPAIHYWGTPVVLISSLNEDGSTNVSPMSSAWWLG